LNNPFVTGILEAYWNAYESVGLNMYAGSINYLHKVWDYHNQMVESICNGNYPAGREALIAHTDLLTQRASAYKGDK
jgi:DNA-binding GntR family transcriptional regulator